MNLGEIEQTIYERFGFGPTPDSSVVRRMRNYVNQTQREVLGMRGFGKLRRGILTTASLANSPFMVLPQASVKIIAIADRTTQRCLQECSIQDIRFRDPGLTQVVSNPDSYAIINYAAAVARDPSAASSIFVISDSSNDGQGVTVSIEGVITGGYPQRASVALNGITGVDLNSSITNWIHISKFYISSAARGNVTLREGSGAGTELARIAPGRAYARYTQVHLVGTPSAAVTYYCDVELRVDNMVHTNDEPLLPEEFHDILEIGAFKKEYMKREKPSLWKIEDNNWTRRIGDLRAFLSRTSGTALGPNRKGQGRSQLGPNFPSGT